jgi:pimeloyl-ACP methyl ester carboxylesterase
VATRVLTGSLDKTLAAHAAMAEPEVMHSFLADVDQLRDDLLARIAAGKLRTDTLVIWGNNDPSAPLARGLELYARLTDGGGPAAVEMHIVDRAGHYSFREQADAVNQLLLGYLSVRLGAQGR